MDSKTYMDWALTKDRSTESYQELGDRLQMQPTQLHMLHAVLGLSGEVGEIVDAVKKGLLYNKPLDVENLKEELGDLMWYAALLLHSIGSSFEEVMEGNRAKLEKRYPLGFSEQNAIARMDKPPGQ